MSTSDPGFGTADDTRPPAAALPSAGGILPAAPSDGGTFVPGQRWRGLIIVGPAPGGPPLCYLADNVSTMERMIVHPRRITDDTEWRRGAWERLVKQHDPALVPALDAYEEGGWRYEVSVAPAGTPLRQWIAVHRGGPREIEMLVRQLSPVLRALHREGVVHLNVRPDTVYVEETPNGLVFTLGGLHAATLYTQPRLAPAEVDPFYAPPEAAGLTVHQPGTPLCAWDWWSLGRVAQEFLLGVHVLSLVLHRDVSLVTPELRQRAELLLLERAPPGIRAGAVEEMPDMDGATTTLLRGLLASSHEARWGIEAVQRWLRHEPIKDYYELPRTARLWSWKGRPFTIPEAAAHFTQDEPWEEGETNLFDPDDAETLAHFLRDNRALLTEWERLQAALEMAELSAWEHVPAAARRPAIAAAAWLALAATGGPAQLRVRGRTIDAAGLQQLLNAPGAMDAAAMVDALLAPPFVHFIEPFDPAAARVLTTLAAVGGQAARLATEHGWLDPQDGAEHTRLLTLALQPVSALRKRATQIGTRFATNRHPVLARLLAQATHTSSELVVLVFAGEAKTDCGFVTHEAWRLEKLAELHGRAERSSRALFWLRLRQILRLGRPIGEPWPVFGGVALAIAAAAGIGLRSATTALGLAVALLAARVWLTWWVRQMIRRCQPGATVWTWRDGLPRCETELGAYEEERDLTLSALDRRLRALKLELAKLAGADAHAKRLPEPQWWELWGGFAVTLAFAAFAFLPGLNPPPPAPIVAKAPAAQPGAPASKPVAAEPEKPAFDPTALIASGDYEIVDDGFGRGLRGPLKHWELHAPAFSPPLEIVARAPASPEQAAFALVNGTLALRPYARKAVNVLLAVRVPTMRGFGVMVFNSRERHLESRDVLLVRQPLAEREWYQTEEGRVLYLGVPAALAPEISLAPP